MLTKFFIFLNKKLSYAAYDTLLPNFQEDFNCEKVFMIAKLPGDEKDWHGKRIKYKIDLGNTFSWERFFRKPLTTNPSNLSEIESFLHTCTYLSDMETRGCQDYWEPPDIFEERKTGDCEDHAIWAWRHLHQMGYKTRLVLGNYKSGHAWVQIYVNGRVYLLEATQKITMLNSTKRYTAYWSVQRMSNKRFSFYEHSPPRAFPFGPR